MIKQVAYHAFLSSKDTQFGDCYFEIFQMEKRLFRATLEAYERNRTYVFLKFFKKAAEEYEFEQRISLTLEKLRILVNKAEKLREAATQDSPTKTTSPKKQKLNQCGKDGGSNV